MRRRRGMGCRRGCGGFCRGWCWWWGILFLLIGGLRGRTKSEKKWLADGNRWKQMANEGSCHCVEELTQDSCVTGCPCKRHGRASVSILRGLGASRKPFAKYSYPHHY